MMVLQKVVPVFTRNPLFEMPFQLPKGAVSDLTHSLSGDPKRSSNFPQCTAFFPIKAEIGSNHHAFSGIEAIRQGISHQVVAVLVMNQHIRPGTVCLQNMQEALLS